jgi:hypothetical protein
MHFADEIGVARGGNPAADRFASRDRIPGPANDGDDGSRRGMLLRCAVLRSIARP